ncbi:ATP binding protein [Coprinellus micaceus]|uniref:ATP binding protein n=1 Tax=Coprinellus micaceus TaxID=71717 RepID=A0A4Y7TWU3_COPMI|nr:ATP binding protein [Coprinellus micaceus]
MSSEERTTETGPLLDTNILKEIAKKDLVNALNAVNGAKTLVLDSTLAGPLGLVTEVALLKQHGVDKMFWLEPGPLTSTTSNIVYLCRPKIKYVKIIADQIKRHAQEAKKHMYTLILTPRVSTLVTRILEEEGVLGEVTLTALNLQFIPLAEDVISLENEFAFRELWVDGDETVLFDSAQGLLSLQKLVGPFPQIVGKGDYAKRLSSLLVRQNKTPTSAAEAPLSSAANVDSLIILDRKVDLITPLLTQLTYEGLIDELIGIRNSHVELPVAIINPPPANAPSASAATASTSAVPIVNVKKDAKKKYHLTTSTDPLYAELRDLNFSNVGRKLNTVARRLDEDYKTNLQSKTVAQLRDFVGKLGGLQTEHQSLRIHTAVSELILPLTRTDVFNKSLEIQQNLLASYEVSAQIAAIEDLIAQGADMQIVVRLLCLASITAGGIKAKTLENIKRELLQTYGFDYLPMLLSLAQPSLAMLLPNPLPPSLPPSGKYPFSLVRKSLRLLIDDNPEALEEVENDIGFVYSGWAPISIRLVQCIAQKGGVLSNPAEKEKPADEQSKSSIEKVQAHPIVGWKGFEDIVSTLPGETVEVAQRHDETGSALPPMSASPIKEQTSTTVVFFLGGCTYTEIAALRWVGRQNKGRRFLIATTGIVSGASLVESLATGIQSGEPKSASA